MAYNWTLEDSAIPEGWKAQYHVADSYGPKTWCGVPDEINNLVLQSKAEHWTRAHKAFVFSAVFKCDREQFSLDRDLYDSMEAGWLLRGREDYFKKDLNPSRATDYIVHDDFDKIHLTPAFMSSARHILPSEEMKKLAQVIEDAAAICDGDYKFLKKQPCVLTQKKDGGAGVVTIIYDFNDRAVREVCEYAGQTGFTYTSFDNYDSQMLENARAALQRLGGNAPDGGTVRKMTFRNIGGQP